VSDVAHKRPGVYTCRLSHNSSVGYVIHGGYVVKGLRSSSFYNPFNDSGGHMGLRYEEGKW